MTVKLSLSLTLLVEPGVIFSQLPRLSLAEMFVFLRASNTSLTFGAQAGQPIAIIALKAALRVLWTL